jgi:hypothetical protein
MPTTPEDFRAALLGLANVRRATGSLSKIVGAVAAQPASGSCTPSPMTTVMEGNLLTVTKGGVSVVYEADVNNDGVSEGHVAVCVGDSGQNAVTFAGTLAVLINTAFSAVLTATWDSTTFSCATNAAGDGESFTISGEGMFAAFNMSPTGADAIAETGSRFVTLAPGVVGKSPEFLFVTASNLGDDGWTGDILIGGKLGGTFYPRYRILAPSATGTASTGRNYGMVIVPASWGPNQTIEPDRYGPDEQPADLTVPLPAGAALVAFTTGSTGTTTAGDESTGSEVRIAALFTSFTA